MSRISDKKIRCWSHQLPLDPLVFESALARLAGSSFAALLEKDKLMIILIMNYRFAEMTREKTKGFLSFEICYHTSIFISKGANELNFIWCLSWNFWNIFTIALNFYENKNLCGNSHNTCHSCQKCNKQTNTEEQTNKQTNKQTPKQSIKQTNIHEEAPRKCLQEAMNECSQSKKATSTTQLTLFRLPPLNPVQIGECWCWGMMITENRFKHDLILFPIWVSPRHPLSVTILCKCLLAGLKYVAFTSSFPPHPLCCRPLHIETHP